MQESNFDKKAATWDAEIRRVKLAQDVAASIIYNVHPTRDMDVMDFGCGTGLLTLSLHPHVRSITGIDSSRGMLEVLTEKVRDQGIANVRALYCDVERGERPEGRYHLIVSSMTLHHVADIAHLFRLFYGLLLPGGALCIADLDKEEGTFHDDPTGIHHFGFDRKLVQANLADAGFTVTRDNIISIIRKGPPDEPRDYPVFLISASRP
jgi:ubiquinone/menaquinone biosynthesis C-methylase UbiE